MPSRVAQKYVTEFTKRSTKCIAMERGFHKAGDVEKPAAAAPRRWRVLPADARSNERYVLISECVIGRNGVEHLLAHRSKGFASEQVHCWRIEGARVFDPWFDGAAVSQEWKEAGVRCDWRSEKNSVGADHLQRIRGAEAIGKGRRKTCRQRTPNSPTYRLRARWAAQDVQWKPG